MVINVKDWDKSFICSNKSAVARALRVSRNRIESGKIYRDWYYILKKEILLTN